MFKIRKCLVAVLALFLSTLVINSLALAKEYTEVDAATVKKMMASADTLVIFPLSPIEFNNLHIKDSINIPIDNLETQLPDDKSIKLVFYCLGVKCVASWRAAEKAVELGYKNVYAFREGLPGWTAAGYPTVTVEKLPDVKVKRISTAELASKLATEPVVLVDVNFNADAHKFHIDHAKRVHIPLDELHLKVAELDQNKETIVLCLKGHRAPTAARYLIGKGFTDVKVVEGGVQMWVMDGRPVKQNM